MFYQIKRFVVEEGFSGQIVERFGGNGGLITQQPGFVDKQVLVKTNSRGNEEVLVVIRWESQADWKNWVKSPEHIAGHKAKAKEGKPKPAYVIETSQDLYEVKA